MFEKVFEWIKSEPVLTRLFAIIIAVVTGTILYYRFWFTYLKADFESYIIAFFVALGSAVLIDRTLARAQDVRDRKTGKFIWLRLAFYVILVIVCAAVFILDRGAEIFVMQNNRAKDLIEERNERVTEAKASQQVIARMKRIEWLKGQIKQEAKNDSLRFAGARVSHGDRVGYLNAKKSEVRAQFRQAKRDNDSLEVVSLAERLDDLSRETASEQAIISGSNKGSMTAKYQRDLAREDSLFSIELNSEVARIESDKVTMATAGFESNPIGAVLAERSEERRVGRV